MNCWVSMTGQQALRMQHVRGKRAALYHPCPHAVPPPTPVLTPPPSPRLHPSLVRWMLFFARWRRAAHTVHWLYGQRTNWECVCVCVVGRLVGGVWDVVTPSQKALGSNPKGPQCLKWVALNKKLWFLGIRARLGGNSRTWNWMTRQSLMPAHTPL